jgi:hypothetical protein
MKPSIGRIVHYQLTEQDAAEITRRRTDGPSIAARIAEGKWPTGAQAHVGNPVKAGDVFPMVIVRVWDASEQGAVNGRVLLDGSDEFWATSRCQVATDSTDKAGCWFAPPRSE